MDFGKSLSNICTKLLISNRRGSKHTILLYEVYRKTQRSLEFDVDLEIKRERIDYMKLRYKDIAECDSLNNDVRLRAYEIYTTMDKILLEKY